jgi:hypothetical protein
MKVDKSIAEAQPYRLAPHGSAPREKQFFLQDNQNPKQKMEHL